MDDTTLLVWTQRAKVVSYLLVAVELSGSFSFCEGYDHASVQVSSVE